MISDDSAASAPLVSVVVPVYNARETVEATLASIRAQTWPNLEIIVVDDGSTDDSCAVVEREAALDPRIRLLRKANGGVSTARNAGTAASRGAFIAPVDADDLLHPTRIARQMARMAELGPECGLVYTLAATVDMSGRVTGTKGFPGFEGAAFLRVLLVNPVGNGSALLLRKAALEDVGGYEPEQRNCADWHLQAKVARRWRWGAVNEALTGYRSVTGSLKSNHLKMRLAQLDAVRRIAARHPETPADVLAALEAVARSRLAITRLRKLSLFSAAQDAVKGLALAPGTALETMVVEEIGRLAGKALTCLLGRGGHTPGEPFDIADPRSQLSCWPKPPRARLLRRLAEREEMMFSTPSNGSMASTERLEATS